MFSDSAITFILVTHLAMNPLAAVAGLVVLFGVIVQVSLQPCLVCLVLMSFITSTLCIG